MKLDHRSKFGSTNNEDFGTSVGRGCDVSGLCCHGVQCFWELRTLIQLLHGLDALRKTVRCGCRMKGTSMVKSSPSSQPARQKSACTNQQAID